MTREQLIRIRTLALGTVAAILLVAPSAARADDDNGRGGDNERGRACRPEQVAKRTAEKAGLDAQLQTLQQAESAARTAGRSAEAETLRKRITVLARKAASTGEKLANAQARCQNVPVPPTAVVIVPSTVVAVETPECQLPRREAARLTELIDELGRRSANKLAESARARAAGDIARADRLLADANALQRDQVRLSTARDSLRNACP